MSELHTAQKRTAQNKGEFNAKISRPKDHIAKWKQE